jgi:hypothetical protein
VANDGLAIHAVLLAVWEGATECVGTVFLSDHTSRATAEAVLEERGVKVFADTGDA